jgi:hypothetical protein
MTTAKLLLTGMALCLSIESVTGQSGIYMSAEDYKDNKITYECNVRIHDFFYSRPEVTVVHDGKKQRYEKSALYGYKQGDAAYRFYKNTAYQIAEAGAVTIYTQTKNITQSKGYKVVNVYYFSKGIDGAVLPLTFANLKNAYRDNEAFTDLLDIYFSNAPVTDYDQVHKMYRVNYVYHKTNKQ